MSDALTDAQMLSLWERGLALGPTERALLTLEVAQPGVDAQAVARWPLGRRDGLLLELRKATFGPVIHYRARCPFCLTELEFDVAVDSLKQAEACASDVFGAEIEGVKLKVRSATSEDLRAIEALDDPTRAAEALWARCVSVDGDEASSISNVSEAVRAGIESLLESADPQADLSFSLSCADCGGTWIAPCDIAETLWREIAESARAVFAQVDALARRYGWTEGEILRLGRRRRDMYLAFQE